MSGSNKAKFVYIRWNHIKVLFVAPDMSGIILQVETLGVDISVILFDGLLQMFQTPSSTYMMNM